MGHQLVQQASQRWRTISSTEGPQVYCKFLQSAPHWVHCSYQKNLWWAQWEHCRKGLHRNLPKNQGSSTTLQGKEGPLTTPPERKGRPSKPSGEDPSHVVLTVDKGVALAVMDKSQYIDKCMALLNDTKVYKPCKDTTKKLHRDVQESLQRLNREHRTSRLYRLEQTLLQQIAPHR